jgi:hypothetical protein
MAAIMDYVYGTFVTNAGLMEQAIDRLVSLRGRLEGQDFEGSDLEWIDTNIENLRLMWTTFSVAAQNVQEHEGHEH